MKKILLLSFIMLAGFVSVTKASEEYWVDVNFTRDSTSWLSTFPALAPSGDNMQVSVNGTFQGFNCKGTFGKFAPSATVYQPFNIENASEHFIYAFRLNRADNVYWTFPEVSNVSKIKVHVQCGSPDTPGEFTLQKCTGTVEGVDTWAEFDPAIKFSAPGNGNLATDVVIEKTLNISTPVKLRFLSLGSATKNVHLYAVTISKYTVAGIDENVIDGVKLNLSGRTIEIVGGEGKNLQTAIYDMSGIQIGKMENTGSFTLPSAGAYLVRIKTADKMVTKKIMVF